MAKTSISRAASRFRQLCCLGLDSEIVMPALLGELHSLVPSLANTFYFLNPKGETTHIYLENTEYLRLLPIYWEVVHERSERLFKGASFFDAAQTQFGVHTFECSVAASRDAFFRSEEYNLTQRHVGYDPNFMRLIVRQGGRVLGGVRMWRSLGRGTWTSEEQRRLGALEPFFVHALTVHDSPETQLVEGDATGLIVADTAGRAVYFTAAGKELLFLATHPQNGPDTVFAGVDVLPPRLVRLCKDLRTRLRRRPLGRRAHLPLPQRLGRLQFPGSMAGGRRRGVRPHRGHGEPRGTAAGQAYPERGAPAAQPPPGRDLRAPGGGPLP